MNAVIYPEAARLHKELTGKPVGATNMHHIYRTAVGIVMDYEHGVAELEEIGVTPQQYVDVLIDFFNTITAESESIERK